MKKNFKFSIFNFQLFLITAILILAAFLRLYRIQDYMTFLGDEGRDVLVVYNILHGHFTLLGPTASVGGFFLGPIYYYFMTPFLFLFGYNPVGPAVMVALFGIATVWLVYKVGTEFFGKRGGIIASFLYSISPMVIVHSRFSWNPNLVPFFSLLCLYLIYKARLGKIFLLSGFLFGILMQLHYLSVFLGVIIVLYMLFAEFLQAEGFTIKVKNLLQKYLLFLGGFIIGWSPFLAFEVRHGFLNIRNIFYFVFHSGDTGGNGRFLQIISDVFFRLFARLLTNFPSSEQISAGIYKNVSLWHAATLLLAIVSILILVYKAVKSFHSDKKVFKQISLLLFWLFFGVLLFGFYKKPIYDYYFEFMFPLPFLIVGGAISEVQKAVGKYSKAVRLTSLAVIAVIILSLTWINIKSAPFLSEPNRQLYQMETISKFVFNKTEGKPFNFALITGSNSDFAYRYFFTLWGRPPVTIENFAQDPNRKTVTNQLLVVCESLPCHPLGNSLWEIAGFGRAEIVGEWNVSVVKVYKLIHYQGK